MKLIFLLPLFVCALAAVASAAVQSKAVYVRYDSSVPTLEFATSELQNALKAAGLKPDVAPLTKKASSDGWTVIAGLQANMRLANSKLGKLAEEAFAIRVDAKLRTIYVLGADPRGAMYGVLDMTEHIEHGGSLATVKAKTEKPAVSIRSLKLNMPGWATLDMNDPEWKDDWKWFLSEEYWRSYFRMMARNRYNISTIWHEHPYHWMVKIPKYPEAQMLTDAEMERCHKAFSFIFAEAARHGMETYLITWNIHYPPPFAKKHNIEEWGQDTPAVRDYMREAIKAVLREYPGLTGIGTCPGEAMPGPSAKDEEWLMDTYVPAILEVRGPQKFIHRYWGAEPKPMQEVFASKYPGKTYLDLKYNGESMYSSPKPHFVDPAWLEQEPRDYEILWHLRNDDIYVMRWGDASFVRETMKYCVGDGIAGFVTGSEYERPGPDRFYTDYAREYQTWTQDFEKHWYRFMLWGKLSYNPRLSDAYFSRVFTAKYGKSVGPKLFEIQTVASKITPLVDCFHWNYMNFDWAVEACMDPNSTINTARDGKGRNPNYKELGEYRSNFNNIREWIFNWTIDDEDFIGIPEYVGNLLAGVKKGSDEAKRQTPIEVAQTLDSYARQVENGLKLINPAPNSPAYKEVVTYKWDLELLALLARFYGERNRGGSDLLYYWCTGDAAAQQRAIASMKKTKDIWLKIVALGDKIYKFPRVSIMGEFQWSKYLKDIDQDVAFAEGPAPFKSRIVEWTALEPAGDVAACEAFIAAGRVDASAFRPVTVKTTEIDIAGSGAFGFWLEMANKKSRYLNLRRVWPEKQSGTAFLTYDLPSSDKRWCVLKNDLGRVDRIWYGSEVVFDRDKDGAEALKRGLPILVQPGVDKLTLRCDAADGEDWGCSLRPEFRDSYTITCEARDADTVIATIRNTFPKTEIKDLKLSAVAWAPGWELTPADVTVNVGERVEQTFKLKQVDPNAKWTGVTVQGDFGGERRSGGAFTELTGIKTRPAMAGDGAWRTEFVDGKWAMRSQPEESNAYIYFNVDNDYLQNVDKDVQLLVEYYDNGEALEYSIEYDSHLDGPGDGAFHGVPGKTLGVKGWQTMTVNLPRARFSNRANGCDLRMSGPDGRPVRLRVVEVRE